MCPIIMCMTEIFGAGIIDFNLKRMTPEEVSMHNLPTNLADWRQYPLRIGRALESSASWYSPETIWFYAELFNNPDAISRLMNNDALFLSGSGLSAFKLQENPSLFDADVRNSLEEAQKSVRDFLGQRKWVFGTCFGGQLAAETLGAKLGRLPNNPYGNAITEAGWLEHRLTKDGKDDEVFGYLKDKETVWAPHLHNDYVDELPAEGHEVYTSSGQISVVESKRLLVRNGYLGVAGPENENHEYIHAGVITFDNGARFYFCQFHPEMATKDGWDFLVRRNSHWVGESMEMGEDYAETGVNST